MSIDAARFDQLRAEAHRLNDAYLEETEAARTADANMAQARAALRKAQQAVRDYAEECAGFPLAYLGD